MSKPKQFQWIESLSYQKRIAIAKSKVNALVDRVRVGLLTRASNKAIQFPKTDHKISRAAVCFNHLLSSQLKFESLILSTIWDTVGKDRNSIPTIVALVNCDEILVQLRSDAEEQYPHLSEAESLHSYHMQRRIEEGELFDIRWQRAKEIHDKFATDRNFFLLREYRNFELAHTISGPDISIDKSQIRLAEPFWSDTLECVENLFGSINLSDFDFDGAMEINDNNAIAFWSSL